MAYIYWNMAALNIITVNCQGMGDPEQRKDVLSYLKQKNMNIYCLQDTHFICKLEPYIQSQWGYKMCIQFLFWKL